MKITGELLKAERLKKNISIQDAAFSLKLSGRIITALEEGNLKILPAKTFVRGFVKSYAEYLKLDSEMVLRQFQEEMGSTQPLPKTSPPQPVEVVQKRLARTAEEEKASESEMLNNNSQGKTFIYMGIAALILVVIVGVNRFVEHYQKQKTADLLAAVEPQKVSSPETALVKQEAAATTAPEASATTPETLPLAQTATEVASPSAAPQSQQPTAPVAQQAVTQVAPEDIFEPASDKPVEVIVEAKKVVEFQYAKGNSKNFTTLSLQPKQIHIIRSPSGLHVKTNDGSAIILTVNGVDRGTPFATVKPFKATY